MATLYKKESKSTVKKVATLYLRPKILFEMYKYFEFSSNWNEMQGKLD